MPAMDSIHLYPQANLYWELVKKTLGKIFSVDSASADALRKESITWPIQEQLLLYHREPFHIAADLAGRQPTEQQTEEYIRMATEDGWYVNWPSP